MQVHAHIPTSSQKGKRTYYLSIASAWILFTLIQLRNTKNVAKIFQIRNIKNLTFKPSERKHFYSVGLTFVLVLFLFMIRDCESIYGTITLI